MEVLKRIVTIVLSVILWLVILLAALFAFTTLATKDADHLGSIAGFTPLTVQSDSMSPTFNKGDMIVVQQTDTNSLKEGDIVTFHTIIDNEYALNTHRIASISTNNGVREYTTKGDNNAIEDTHIISDGDIVGKEVMVLPGLGNVMNFLSSSVGFLLVIVLPMLIFFVYQVYHLITVSISLKRATQEEARQAEAERIVAAEESEGKAALEEAERIKAEAAAQLAEAQRLKAEAQAGGEPQVEATAEAELQPEAAAQPQSEPKAEAEPQPEAEPQVEPNPEAEPEAKPEAEAEAEPKAESQPEAKPEAESELEAEPEVEQEAAKPEAEAQPAEKPAEDTSES